MGTCRTASISKKPNSIVSKVQKFEIYGEDKASIFHRTSKMAQGDQQQFCLRWNDFQTNMVSSFKHLRDEKSFTDVTLACDGQTCKAHKMVLSACSPYFKALLEENPAKHPIIILKDVPFQHLTAILEFIYAGEVNV